MYINKAILYGNLTRDPEIRALPSGIQVASFGIATNRVYKDKNGAKQESTDFHNIVVFGRQAETAAQYLKKGQGVFIEGRIQTRSWDDKDGQKKEPIVIHRSSIGAIERTMAFLLEHYAGALPFWLSPVQIHIIPIADRHLEYAQKVKNELKDFRVEINDAQETLGKKIREAEMQKIPYILVVGDKEIASNAVGVRERGKGDLGTVTLDNFIKNTCGNSTHQLNA